MFHRNLIVALCALSMLSLATGASAAPAPETGDPFVDETVATTGEYTDVYTSQWIAFVTRSAGIIYGSSENMGADADAASLTIQAAAIDAQEAISSAILEQDAVALSAAVTDFEGAVGLAAVQFQADTQQAGLEFGQDATVSTQLFAIEQRDVSFAFADSMRSVTADYGTDDVRVVSSMAEFLTVLAFGSSAELSQLVFNDVATQSFVIVNDAAADNAQGVVGATGGLTLEGILALGDFRANRLEDVGGSLTTAQNGVRDAFGSITGPSGAQSQVGSAHETVNGGLTSVSDAVSDADVDTARTTVSNGLLTASATVSGGAAGGIATAGGAVQTSMSSGAAPVFELLRS